MKRTSRPVEQLRLTEKLYWIVQLYGSRLLKVILMLWDSWSNKTLKSTAEYRAIRLRWELLPSVDTLIWGALFGWERGRCKCTRLWQQYSFDDNMSSGHLDVASYLLKHGAHINLQDNDERSCLHYASKQGHVQLVCELLASGAKQNTKS